ncbi:MAG TPA: hypothetical protein VMY18_06570 [Acidobacteriota bacterium]|nr:hypothetical protein [Acidobacteriota bacterium]
MRIQLIALVILLVHAGTVFSQEQVLKNEDILKMVEAGLSPDLIVEMVRNSPGDYDTNVNSIVALKEKGVSDSILAAMVVGNSRRDTAEPGPTGTEEAVSKEDTAEDVPEEIGIYFVDKRSNEVRFMEPEIVTWKTGGFMKSVATMGISKGHINGTVKNPTSRYILDGDEEIVIYCPEGTSGNEYQLLKLWEKKNRREFRTFTGGVVHASGGADENSVAFDPVRTAPRVYRFKLPDLVPGEYGLLPPGAQDSASAASMGKIYAFTVGR